LKRAQEPGRGRERSSGVGITFKEKEVIVVVAMVAYELRLRINWKRKRGRQGRLKARASQEVRQEDESEVWAEAYIPIVCLKTNRYGNCSYKYEVLVVFRLHFGKCNLRSDRCSVGDQGVLSRLQKEEFA
jgi:hypothetical protein